MVNLCRSRIYTYPHHGGNWKFQRGGRSRAQEIPERRGVSVKLHFQMVKFNTVQISFKIVPYLL